MVHMYYSTNSRRIAAGWTRPGPETASSTDVPIKSCGAHSIVAGSSKEPSTNVSHRSSSRYGPRDAPVVELEATPVAYTCSWSVNGSTASTAWPRPSRPGRLGCSTEFASGRSRLPTLWTSSHLVATVGGPTLEVVRRNVENQPNAQAAP